MVKRIVLWAGRTLCIVCTAWVVWGFLQFDNAVEHPSEGDFSGWQRD